MNFMARENTTQGISFPPELLARAKDRAEAKGLRLLLDESPRVPQGAVGDATRLDLLRTAGAAQARVLVIAVDDMSNYPAEALDKPHDLSGFEPNVEAIAALEPDLVLMQDDTVKDQLEALGIAVWVGPAASNGLGAIRSLALYKDKVYLASTDAHMVALDAASGWAFQTGCVVSLARLRVSGH